MASEFIAGLGLFKTAFDLAKGLKDINDATIRNGAVIELQEKILTAREQQAALLERVSELEKEVADLKAWDRDKEHYSLKEVDAGAFAYVPQPETDASRSSHWLCAHCYEDGKKSYLQSQGRTSDGKSTVYQCQRCKGGFKTHWNVRPNR